ncbi:hypothetical protein FACS189443_1190 [Planctomycetales bacterium]|nr:hypothetical protein FACS189443_1190 [Planctomycetales bacterium]
MSDKQSQLFVIGGRHRAAFTLVELLIVVMVISILAALTLVASNVALKAAKEAKTRATILKLDTALRQIYEGYEERFENIFDGLDSTKKTEAEALPEPKKTELKLHLIHDLMRMELPQCSTDVTNPCQQDGDGFILGHKPAVSEYYSSGAGNAELLFQIIQNLSPETLEAFQGSEIGDVDSNGLYEFLDAWGKPIRFIRFAPALPQSDLQPDLWKIANKAPTDGWNSLTQTDFDTARSYYPDPLDPNQLAARGWFLYPVIFSAGADQKYDLQIDDTPNNTQTITPFEFPNGIPLDEDSDGEWNHYDNISNHRLSGY